MPRSPALTRLAVLLVALALAGCRGGTAPASPDEAGASAEAAAAASQEPTAAQTEEENASDDESARTRPPASASPETTSAQPTEKYYIFQYFFCTYQARNFTFRKIRLSVHCPHSLLSPREQSIS